MAFPFGGHPTLSRFVEEAHRLGCTAEVEVRETKVGRAYIALVLRNAAGAALTIPDPDFEEHLSPSVVTNYQRRLSIHTNFAAQPEPPSPSSGATTFVKDED